MNSARPSDQQLPRAGDIVAGKYRVESVIGTGGMGVVLGAEDTSLGRRVAIKFLAPHKARNDDAVARFVREARAAASLQSEHVVRVFEVGTLPTGASFIVMEHLAGGDLAQLLAGRGPLPVEEAVDYLLQACEALAEAHGKGIVHRDLKPQNLFVAHLPDGSPCVKVLDFGISKAVDEGAQNLTATDTVMGTPLYMSPEQVRSLKSVDLRSDVWSLGAILFELLTASPIYEATTATALCAMIAMDPPTPLRAKRPSAPPELESVIGRCLHKDPAGRFQDVAALADALAPFAGERGRLSATRISRVVRAGSAQGAAGAFGAPPRDMGVSAFGTTGGATGGGATGGGATGSGAHPSFAPPGAAGFSGYPTGAMGGGMPGAMPPLHTSSHFAPAPQASTQDAWQRQTGAIGPGTIEQRRSGSMLVAILGVVAGLFLLAIIAGAGVYIVSQRDKGDSAKNQDDAGAPVAAVASAPASAAAPVAAAGGAPGAGATTVKRPDPKGAGTGAVAAAGAKDAGTPAAAGTADEEAAKLARQKQFAQAAQGRCSLQQGELSRNDANNTGARNVKTQACLQASSLSPNAGTALCERATCRTACTILKDQLCLMQLDSAERNNPLRF